jgi:hypothetical protein
MRAVMHSERLLKQPATAQLGEVLPYNAGSLYGQACNLPSIRLMSDIVRVSGIER